MIIDSHCHLDSPKLYDQLDNVVKRAVDNNVKCLLTICTTLESFEKIKLITKKYQNIYGTFGIHPHETDNINVSRDTILKSIEKHPKLIAIGETGLDFHYNHSKKDRQIKSFNEHIESAIQINVPIIVHSRNAEEETLNVLNKYKKQNPKILMHCFTGSYGFFKDFS